MSKFTDSEAEVLEYIKGSVAYNLIKKENKAELDAKQKKYNSRRDTNESKY